MCLFIHRAYSSSSYSKISKSNHWGALVFCKLKDLYLTSGFLLFYFMLSLICSAPWVWNFLIQIKLQKWQKF